MALFLNCLLIFSVRIVDVALATLLTVLIVRGKRVLGSLIGFVDIIIWFLIVRVALSTENASIWIAIAYAGGYATGTYIGSWLDEKLAIGNYSVQVISRGERYDLVEALRDKGFAVSTIPCQGKRGKNLLLIIETNRKKVKYVRNIINEVAPDSFIVISDVRQIINGYINNGR
jgi:uncharacterized protein YebE (UPF0316 family)